MNLEKFKTLLKKLPNPLDQDCAKRCLEYCLASGFSEEDAIRYTKLTEHYTEHYDPNLSEETALRLMREISQKYRTPKTEAVNPEIPMNIMNPETDKHGTKRWFLYEQLHRENGPAVEFVNGTKCWYVHGYRHRIDGPAIEFADGEKWWYIHDVELTEQEFNEKLKPAHTLQHTLQRAFQCRQDLFKVLTLFKETHMQAVASADVSDELIGQLDTAASELARLCDSLPYVFVARVHD